MGTDRVEFMVTDHESMNRAMREFRKYFENTYQPFVVQLYKTETPHSRNQQNTFRGWCRVISHWNGDDPQAIHDFFCEKFIGTVTREAFGETKEHILGTSTLGKKRMAEFMEQVESWIVKNLPEITLPQWEADNGA